MENKMEEEITDPNQTWIMTVLGKRTVQELS